MDWEWPLTRLAAPLGVGEQMTFIDQKKYLAKIKIVLKQLTVNIKSTMYYSGILFKNYNYAVSSSTH